jgi:C1A family cysteine protease
MENKYKLVHTFQKPDTRDYTYSVEIDHSTNLQNITTVTKTGTSTVSMPLTLASSFIISPLPKIIDQGNLGSCTANAFYYTIMKQTNDKVPISRLYLYANCRCIDNTPLNQDDGTTVRTVCKAILNYGACLETVYPYITNNYANLPSLLSYQSAKRFKTFTYIFIQQNLASIKSALTTYKTPIVFGFMVYTSFMSSAVAATGIVPMPDTTREQLEGGHCVTIVGYNDANQRFTCANSWGTSWGNKGYFYLPYNYVTNPNLASDFCVTTFIY